MTLRLTDPDLKRDPHTKLSALLQAGPISDLSVPFIGKVACTVSHAAGLDLLKSTDQFVMDGRHAGRRSASGFPFLPKTLRLLATNMLTQDDPEHRRLRQLSDAPFRKVQIDSLRPVIHAQVTRLLDEMQQAGNTDFVSGLARPLPLAVISDLLGLGDQARSDFQAIMSSFSTTGARMAVFEILRGLGRIRKVFLAEITRARESPRPGLLSDLISAESDDGPLTDDELFSMIFVLYVAGHETTTHLLSSGLFALLTYPGAWDAFRAGGEADSLLAVDELMRFCAPVQISNPRFAVEDMEFHGRSLRRGQRIVALLAAGNLDPSVFDAPLKLNLSRKPNRHLGWGGGPHLCLGLHLAKAEAEIVLLEMSRRFPALGLAMPQSDYVWTKRAGVHGLEALELAM